MLCHTAPHLRYGVIFTARLRASAPHGHGGRTENRTRTAVTLDSLAGSCDTVTPFFQLRSDKQSHSLTERPMGCFRSPWIHPLHGPWYPRQDSNPQHSGLKPDVSANWTTRAWHQIEDSNSCKRVWRPPCCRYTNLVWSAKRDLNTRVVYLPKIAGYLTPEFAVGLDGEIRTPDLALPKRARYLATLHLVGASLEIRTPEPLTSSDPPYDTLVE